LTHNKQITNTELATLLQAGDEAAFGVLYDNYAAALLGVIYKMTGDKKLAEDLLQEGFIKIWRNIHSYDSNRATLFTWMMNIIRNICIDHFRSKAHKKHNNTSPLDAANAQKLKGSCTSESQDDLKFVQKMTQQLAPRYKDIINLVYIYGYTQAEVSKLLDLPIGTVKTRCKTALKLLRDMTGFKNHHSAGAYSLPALMIE